MENIDKDIEIIKTKIEYYKNNPEGCNWRLSFEDTEDIQAIENVLSELEKKDNQIKLEIEGRDLIVHHSENLKSELEKYKNVTYFEKLEDGKLYEIDKERADDLYEHGAGNFLYIQMWKRKEVENE